MPTLFLTFDVEDFISRDSIVALDFVLETLKKEELHGIFFITGQMVERLESHTDTVERLCEHEIGYHSSGHSVHPTIFEFTDVANYEEAYRASVERESAYINPLNGDIERKGGIHSLRNLFPGKRVTAFRAPGHCWTPPHMDAIRDLRMSYDFSTDICSEPVLYREMSFFPYPVLGHWQGDVSDYRVLVLSLRNNVSVITMHPSLLVNCEEWDSIYRKSNPKMLSEPTRREPIERKKMFVKFEKFLRYVRTLEKLRIVKVTPNLFEPELIYDAHASRSDAERCYRTSMRWAKKHGYAPKFIDRHFAEFFNNEDKDPARNHDTQRQE